MSVFTDGTRSIRLYTLISLQIRLIIKNRHNFLSEGLKQVTVLHKCGDIPAIAV